MIKSFRVHLHGMVSRWSDDGHAVVDAAVDDGVDELHGGSGGQPRQLVRLRVDEDGVVARAERLQRLGVGAAVGAV